MKDLVLILKLGRFNLLFGGLILFLFGVSLAILTGGEVSIKRIIFGYLILFFAHLSVNYSNDYFDVETDSFGKPTPFSGGSGVLVENPHLRKFSRNLAIILIILSIASSLFFLLHFSHSIWLILITILGNLLGWYYAAPPLKLGYRGFGEISQTTVFGVVIPAFGFFVIQKAINSDFTPYSLPLFFFCVAFVFCIEIPDMESDIKGNKRTIITKIGRKRSFIILGLSLVFGSAILLIYGIFFKDSFSYRLLPVSIYCAFTFIIGIIDIFLRTDEKKRAQVLVNISAVSIFGFLIFTDIYFFLLAV